MATTAITNTVVKGGMAVGAGGMALGRRVGAAFLAVLICGGMALAAETWLLKP